MKYLVRLYNWESLRLYASDSEFAEGDKVIVKGEFENDLGTVAGQIQSIDHDPEQQILRRATERDIEAFEINAEKKTEIIEASREEIKRLGLLMKLVDVEISLDGGSVTIIFSAEERVDFRELVKNLSLILHRSVRMHQIGSRDEAKRVGGCGVCGRELCCTRVLRSLPSISIETARVQQVAHRGSERISGQCGRLLCCLSYEASQYQEMMAEMPEIGSSIKTKKGKGEVLEINPLKQEVRMRLESGEIISIKKEEIR